MATDLRTRDEQDDGPIEAEVVSYDLATVTRAEIDIQISTAKRYPRDIQRFLRETESLACRTQEMARACVYSLPARSNNGQPITGPSVRLAEIALHCFGNVRATVRIAAEQDKFIVAQFSGIDLERNVGVQLEVRRRITGRDGRKFGDDMIVMTGNAAAAIALRNGVWKLIPAALIEPIFAKVREVAMGKDVPIEQTRAEWVQYWLKKGVKGDDLYRALGVSGIEAVGVQQIEQMIGWHTSLKDGSVTLHDLFAPPAEPEPPNVAETLIADLKKAKGKQQPKGNGGDLFKGREPGQEG